MKINKLLLILLALMQIHQVWAQQTFGYQAVVRNPLGNPVTNQNVSIQIQIIHGSLFGNAVFVETHSARTNEAGFTNLVIGQGNAIMGEITDIDWSAGPYFLKVEMDHSGGTNYTLTTISEILSVPITKYAKKSGNGFSGSYTSLTNSPDIENWDQQESDDFSGSFNNLTNKPFISAIHDTTTSGMTLWSSSRISFTLIEKTGNVTAYTKTNLQTTGEATVHFTNLASKPANLDEDKSDDLLLSGDQTVNGDKVFTNNILAISGFSNFMTNLYNVSTPVNATDAVPKSYADNLRARVETLEALNNGMVKDYDGNLYTTVKIGNQVWMAENLKTRHTRTGEAYPVHNPNNEAENVAAYGLLYYGLGLSDELCPTGMQIPEDDDWKQLEEYLGMNPASIDSFSCRGTNEGKELKVSGNTGFNALYAGYFRIYEYYGFGTIVDFWCKNTIFDPETGIRLVMKRSLKSDSDKICRFGSYAGTHFDNYGSVRCFKNLLNTPK